MKIEQKINQLQREIKKLEDDKHNGIMRDSYLEWYNHQQIDARITRIQATISELTMCKNLDIHYDQMMEQFKSVCQTNELQKWSLLYQFNKFYELVPQAELHVAKLQQQHAIAKQVLILSR